MRVYPALIDRDHPLASVHGANNAVFVQAEAAGNLMFYGAGAGGVQTASAVLGDVVSAARRHIAGGVGVGESTRANLPDRRRSAASRRATRSRSRSTTSRACSRRSRASSARGASRSRPSSRPSSRSRTAQRASPRLVIGTHKALEQDLSETVDRLAASGVVERVVSVLRVEGD